MQLSMHSICIERKYPLLDAVRKAAEFGYQGYEIDIGDFGNTGLGLHWPEEFTPARVTAAAVVARQAGITISSLCLGVLWRYYPSSADPAVRAQASEIIRQAAPRAASIGARVLLLPVGQPEDLTPEPAREHLIDVLTECAPVAEQAGVILAVENVGQALAATADDLLAIVEAVSSPAVQVYYDVGNAAWTGTDPVRDLHLLGQHVAMVHVKDRAEVSGRGQTVIIGQGAVPFREIGEALREIGYDGYLVLEVPGTAETADDVAVKSREGLLAAGLITDKGGHHV